MKLLLSAVFFSTCSAFAVLPKGRPSLTVKVATDDALFGKKKQHCHERYFSIDICVSQIILYFFYLNAVDDTRASVSKYYGQELSSSEDLKTNACCTAGGKFPQEENATNHIPFCWKLIGFLQFIFPFNEAPPKYIQDCINNINPEVVAKYYGCGLCLPQYPLEGASVLDLGCGAGRDVYIASQLVGPTGKVWKIAIAINI